MRSPRRRLSQVLDSHRAQTVIGILLGTVLAVVMTPIVVLLVLVASTVLRYSGAWP